VEETRFQESYQDRLSVDQCHYIFRLFGNTVPTIVTKYLTFRSETAPSLSSIEFYCDLTKYCVEKEMAIHLKDLVFRRLFPNTPEVIPNALLSKLAQTMSEVLNWTTIQKENEIKETIEQWQTRKVLKY
jgi:glycerol-3-phosphate dehydrogenase